MIPIETILTFISASVILSLAPGPDNIFVLTSSAAQGRLAGICITLGLCTGLILHTVLVALGVAAIFQVSVIAFTTLKIIGAAYLLYIAWQAFKASSSKISAKDQSKFSCLALYKRGIIMNISNPKVAIFFLAFLPQFTSSNYGPISIQIFTLGFLFILCALLVFSLIAFLSGFLNSWFSTSDRAQIILNRIAGTVFIGLALKLVTSEQ